VYGFVAAVRALVHNSKFNMPQLDFMLWKHYLIHLRLNSDTLDLKHGRILPGSPTLANNIRAHAAQRPEAPEAQAALHTLETFETWEHELRHDPARYALFLAQARA